MLLLWNIRTRFELSTNDRNFHFDTYPSESCATLLAFISEMIGYDTLIIEKKKKQNLSKKIDNSRGFNEMTCISNEINSFTSRLNDDVHLSKISMLLCKQKYKATVPLTIFDTMSIEQKSLTRIGCTRSHTGNFIWINTSPLEVLNIDWSREGRKETMSETLEKNNDSIRIVISNRFSTYTWIWFAHAARSLTSLSTCTTMFFNALHQIID